MKKTISSLLAGFLFFTAQPVFAQADTAGYWHGKERSVRYTPDGEDFVIINANRKFTRALYGTNTAFRVETGDQPEFALYLPGMGGNIKFGLIKNNESKWLTNAGKITARYKPGSMLYEIEDALLGKGKLWITVLAMGDAEGVIIQMNAQEVERNVKLVFAYGAVSGKNFSRNGDMGPDPESVFYMKPEYCKNNEYSITGNEFLLQYGTTKKQWIGGIFPAKPKVVSALAVGSPLSLLQSQADSTAVIAGELALKNDAPYYFSIVKKDSAAVVNKAVAAIFSHAETARQSIAGRIKVQTPDAYINTVGAAIGIAADAIWEAPSFMHGAIGWRMRLNGWRGAYAADVLGWHDRARMHFRAYAKSQLTAPPSGPIISDTALHLARQLEKLGTSVFSEGYICRNPDGDFRPHHYDMNLVFIDQLLWHFNWTGDTAFVKEMWPLLTRHLAWEKRNFDADNDGLYDAYAAIWASDALQYSGGAVTHSSAYNFRANTMAAMLAGLIAEDGSQYKKEAEKIINAINGVLWMKEKGVYAEFKDALGLKQLHPHAALWTIYHSLDSDIADPFQAYQAIQYINNEIPHIPLKAKGLSGNYYTISTSNWMPYTWSLNNVALAELMHTSLSFWQSGKNEQAFKLWKSSLMESMYMGGSPGNFQQISTYDAARGEAYRDFADPVGMTARSLIQGLFGILPDALQNNLTIQPGFPAEWNHASLQTPDIKFDFKRLGTKDQYNISPFFSKKLKLSLVVKANGSRIKSVTVNNKIVIWKNSEDAIDIPLITIDAAIVPSYTIIIEWQGSLVKEKGSFEIIANNHFEYALTAGSVKKIFDPQQLFSTSSVRQGKLVALVGNTTGSKTAFVQIQEGAFNYWKGINAVVKQPVDIIYRQDQKKNALSFTIKNNSNNIINARVQVKNFITAVQIPAKKLSAVINVDQQNIIAGSNVVAVHWDSNSLQTNIVNWNVDLQNIGSGDMIDLQKDFNDTIAAIFKNSYLSPRPAVATLQLPTQGIGDWTHPHLTAKINDAGFRKKAAGNFFTLPQNISFKTPQDAGERNIIYTSQWDNYPEQVSVSLSGRASHAYFLMAGSTNPMQSQLVNGKIMVHYTDGSEDSLLLRNPGTWWPIEQDYLNDGYAFNTRAARPVRVHLKTGKTFSPLNDPSNEYNGKMIEGGAATVLDLPLNKNKTLQSLVVKTTANDVVIGLMGLTLIR